jgi:hypothetical protein
MPILGETLQGLRPGWRLLLSTLPRRQYGLFITMGLAAVAALVAGIVLFTSSKAGDVELTTANLVPADAGIYIAFNTNLDTSQWVTAFNLIERLGQDDPEAELRRSLEEEEGVDWDEEIAPFLGGNAAFYLRSFDVDTFQVNGAVILRAKDARKALDVLVDMGDLELDTDEYLDTEYFLDTTETFYAAILGGHLVIAIDEPSILDVIEVHKGDRDSLATNADFRALRDELSRNFLAFVYLDSSVLIDNGLGDDALTAALEEAGIDLAIKPMAGVIGAEGNGFNFQAASVSDPGVVSPMLEPRVSRFAGMVPADAAFFMSTTAVGGAIREALAAAEDDLDDAISASGYGSVDDLFESAGAQLGLESLHDLVDLFEGETAMALWFPTADQDEPQGLLLTEVRDPVQARNVIDALVPSGATRSHVDVGGVDVLVVTSDDGDEFAFAISGSDLLIGTVDAVTEVLEGAGPFLADSATYQRTVADFPTALGSYGYVDMGALLRLAEGGIPAQLDRAEEALDGMIISVVQERGVVRVAGILTVSE